MARKSAPFVTARRVVPKAKRSATGTKINTTGAVRTYGPTSLHAHAEARWPEHGRTTRAGISAELPAGVADYFGLILVILLPWMPSPAISPFWPKMKA